MGIHFQLKWTKVCSRHFREYDFIKTLSGRRELRKNAVPSLFSWTRTSPRKRKAPTVRTQFVKTRRVLLSETQTNEEPVERENASESEEDETNEIEGITKQDMATQTNEIRSKDDSADSDKPRKMFKVTCRITIIERSMSYLFTSSALVLRPLPGSPLHLKQNLSSTFFNSDGFLPQSDAPGISFSSRNDPLDIFDNKLVRVASSLLIPWPYLPRSDAISYHSARAIRHYESRV